MIIFRESINYILDITLIDTLDKLTSLMKENNVSRLYAKVLASNDNSKNQIYLGGDYSSLNIIPNLGVYADDSKGNQGSKHDRFKANILFSWIDENGIYLAPKAQLIFYPQYPEVRLSGILMGCKQSPSKIIASRTTGRILFFGVTEDKKIISYAADQGSPLANELTLSLSKYEKTGVFHEILFDNYDSKTSRILLLDTLRKIHQKGWIDSKRLSRGGILLECNSGNCGGYTLEAELGINPNGIAGPDFHGWEVKQHNVRSFDKPGSSKAITLMTPEPTAGFYKEYGVEQFLRKFGYKDKHGREDRINFGGIYRCNTRVISTGLTMVLEGFNSTSSKIENVDGGIHLINDMNEIAAVWKFEDMMTHWNRKHAKCVYIPSLCRTEPCRQYYFGNIIQLAEGTDFIIFLKAIASGKVYYDPAIKLEKASTAKPLQKRRSQFRIKAGDINSMYHNVENHNLCD
ncbi:hypothetical protein Lfee_0262 [Legionella feeleii]|uniref:MvaI/BcnI restriction endonuclease domain-containing protein n=1 Tax=Legionella feeleii TaxID=453 RepID=A0A0W0U848_9GAMM|nr:hypothetical protein Lfee_0262 [Legionella feeleii]SPX60714.1 Uncharacterised protein [Legionella feeleii]